MNMVYEVDDFVEITNMDLFNGLTGTVTEVKGNVYTVHINASADHSDFYIYAIASELKYIGHYNHIKEI